MSGKYNEGREAFADGDVSWTRGTIEAQLVAEGYVFDPDHRAKARPLRDAAVGSAVAVSAREVATGGWTRCGRLRFAQVPAGKRAAAIVFRLAGDDGTLIFYCNEVANFPMMTNGGDIEVDVPERGLFRV
jgi:hypothetical protein